MKNRFHLGLTVLLAAACVFLTILLMGRTGEPTTDQGNAEYQRDADEPVSNPSIRPVHDADELFDLLNETAYVFEFDGAWIDCWIEVETEGKIERIAHIKAEELQHWYTGYKKRDRENKLVPAGVLIWVRNMVDNRELWSVAIGIRNEEGNIAVARSNRNIEPPQPTTPSKTFNTGSGMPAALTPDKQSVIAQNNLLGESRKVLRSAKLTVKAVQLSEQ